MKQNEIDTNEIYKGITRVIKTKKQDKDVWFAVIGKTIVSRGTFNTKEECIKDLEKTDYEQICKIAIAIATALKDYKPEKVEKV
jgi:hypothetical protein|nr:MAG TPA: hypothetical protein [Microviridae sp.]